MVDERLINGDFQRSGHGLFEENRDLLGSDALWLCM
jgi:hypothetical protein